MPRASLRSVLTIIAESAAFTGLVSSSTASKPALTRAAWSHCDKGPASRPMRASGRLRPLRNVISAAGSLATLGLAHDPAGGVDHAHAALFQRHVNPGKVIHGCPSMCLGPITPDPGSHTSPSGPAAPPRYAGGRPITAPRLIDPPHGSSSEYGRALTL